MHRLLITLFAIIFLNAAVFIPDCLAETTWQSIGPFGGDVQVIAVDPKDSQIVYAGTGRGVFKSTNGGASWVAAINGLDKTIASLAIDPNNSQMLYAGTYQDGIYKSNNLSLIHI